jgi:hypothetical protein
MFVFPLFFRLRRAITNNFWCLSWFNLFSNAELVKRRLHNDLLCSSFFNSFLLIQIESSFIFIGRDEKGLKFYCRWQLKTGICRGKKPLGTMMGGLIFVMKILWKSLVKESSKLWNCQKGSSRLFKGTF